MTSSIFSEIYSFHMTWQSAYRVQFVQSAQAKQCLCVILEELSLRCRPKAYNIIKKEALARVFSCQFCEIPKNTFSTEHLHTTASVSLKSSP